MTCRHTRGLRVDGDVCRGEGAADVADSVLSVHSDVVQRAGLEVRQSHTAKHYCC